MLAFALIVATITAGCFAAPWWVVIAFVPFLTLTNFSEHRAYSGRLIALGETDTLVHAWLARLSTSGGILACAFVAGTAIGWALVALEVQLRTML